MAVCLQSLNSSRKVSWAEKCLCVLVYHRDELHSCVYGCQLAPKKEKKMVLPFFSSLTNQIKPNWIRKQCRLYTCESHGCITRRNSFYVNKWQLCGAEKQSKAITKHSDFTMFNFRAGQNMFTALYNFLLALTCMHWALLHNYSTVSEFFFNTFSSIWILARLYQQSKP